MEKAAQAGNYLPLETQRSKEQQSVLKKAADVSRTAQNGRKRVQIHEKREKTSPLQAAANLATETTLGQISQVSKTLLLAGTCVECASLAPE